jgi:tRNA-2-methylthio-N6-dimethylallyladenosine synthase
MLEDQVAHAGAVERLERLNDLQRGIGTAHLLDKVGTTQLVLVQGPARRGEGRLSGWTEQRETVVIEGGPELAGTIVPVRITGLSGITLHGEIEQPSMRGSMPLELPVLAG